MSLESIALFSCRSPFLDDSKIYTPMGNLVLKSYINHYMPDINVKLMDDDYNLDDLSNISEFDSIGVSVMTPQRAEADKLAQAIRKQYPEKKIIMGGPHVTHYFQEAIANPNFDYIVPGDGEKNILSILKGEAKDKVVMVGGLSKEEMLVQPRPDRTSDNAKEVLRRYNYKLNGRDSTTMMTARGCPMTCTFCEDAKTNIRWTGYESVNAQLDDIVSLGYKGVYIFDDLFAIAMPKVKPICEALKERDIIYRCNGQANFFVKWKEEFAQLLGDTGCYEIAFGHESGHQRILDTITKKTTVEQNYKSVEYAKKYGIKVKSFILLGLPTEDWDSLKATEEFIANSGIDDFQCAVYMPYKGTQIRDAIDRGEDVDLQMLAGGSDGEITGAYGVKGGETSYEVRTKALSADDLKEFRNYLVEKYRPGSHQEKWKDKFFEQAHTKGAIA